eukprot:3525639-Pleurochrysis_carterae.AAC.1
MDATQEVCEPFKSSNRYMASNRTTQRRDWLEQRRVGLYAYRCKHDCVCLETLRCARARLCANVRGRASQRAHARVRVR